MKASFALILAASTAVVACTRIIERPVPTASAPNVVSTPAIVERDRTTAPAGASAAPSCTWASQSYSSGATSCQNHLTYRCNNGSWEQQAAPAC
ncbi:MAG TPA: hypothetical protein VEU32_01465 [Burkholderiales bacterium]|nr:hypothetical protein [Burkholderiales bacterium]